MTIEQYEEFIVSRYTCNKCGQVDNIEKGGTKFVRGYTFWIFSRACQSCDGTGIPAIPWGELKGQTYEAWKESGTPLSEAPPKRRKRRVRKGVRQAGNG